MEVRPCEPSLPGLPLACVKSAWRCFGRTFAAHDGLWMKRIVAVLAGTTGVIFLRTWLTWRETGPTAWVFHPPSRRCKAWPKVMAHCGVPWVDFRPEQIPRFRGTLKNRQRRQRGMEVTILLGSKSDMPVAEKCTKILDMFEVSYQLRVASAHRSPAFVESIIKDAEADGCKIFIAMAGLAAALPGAVAALTTKPVIGVPCGGRVPYDSLLSIVQLPP
ncbi:MAG TPA: AIR carboxylase family protein, partial [Candidatus Poseidoniales archaeon]